MHQAAQRNFDCFAEQLICKFHAIAMRDRMRRFIVSGTEQMEYVHEIDYLRGVSIIGVLLIHVVSEIIWTGRGTPANANYAMFWNQFALLRTHLHFHVGLLPSRYELRGFNAGTLSAAGRHSCVHVLDLPLLDFISGGRINWMGSGRGL